MNDQQSYADYQAQLRADQDGKSKDDIMEDIPAEYKLDLDSLPPVKHNWVERGAVVSCEGAGHPNHRHFLVKR